MPRLLLSLFLGACLLGAPSTARSAPPPPIDSLQMRLTPMISAILADGNGDGTPDRLGDTLAVSGRVTAAPAQLSHVRSNVATLQDDTDGIHARLPDGPLVSRGDSLIVRGRLLQERGLTAIDVTQYRIVPSPPRTPKPVPLTVATTVEDHYEGWLARTRGRVVDKRRTSRGRSLVLESPDGSSSARLSLFVADRHGDRFRLDRFETGDVVEATGIVSQQGIRCSRDSAVDFWGRANGALLRGSRCELDTGGIRPSALPCFLHGVCRFSRNVEDGKVGEAASPL